jgi:hypothetical protein
MPTPYDIEPMRDDAQLAALEGQVEEGDAVEEKPSEVQLLQQQMQQVLSNQMQENQRLREQAAQQKAQTLNFYISQLRTPEEKNYAQSLVQKYYTEEAQKAELQGVMQYTRTLEGYALDKLKKDVTRGISEKYKVERELLEGLEATHPKEVENVAKAIAKYKKQMNFQQRVMSGNDKVPGTSQQSNNSTINSALKRDLQGTGRLAEFIRRGGLG